MKTKMKQKIKLGRHPVEFPKIAVFVYLRHDYVEKIGGKKNVKAMLEAHFNTIATGLQK